MVEIPRIENPGERWVPNSGQDPARYLIDPGSVNKAGRARAGNLRHARPFIVNGAKTFIFPLMEGFTRSGASSLGLHRYINGKEVDGRIMLYEEGRIQLTGTFPGITSQQHMVDCIHVLTSVAPPSGMTLYAPGVFDREQFVLPETWSFNHDPDDRTHSIDFQIGFVRIGAGVTVHDPKGTPPPPQPVRTTTPRGKSSRVFTVKEGARTFQAIAIKVYNNSGQWEKLAKMNETLVHKSAIPLHKLPSYRWAMGTKIHY